MGGKARGTSRESTWGEEELEPVDEDAAAKTWAATVNDKEERRKEELSFWLISPRDMEDGKPSGVHLSSRGRHKAATPLVKA